MNLFETLLEIKTARRHLNIKAVYIPNSTKEWAWSYYTYYYDAIKHSLYINNLDSNTKQNAMKIIDKIVNSAYKKEMSQFIDIFSKVQMQKKLKVFCFSYNKQTKEVVIDKVALKSIKSDEWDTISFKSQSKSKSSIIT